VGERSPNQGIITSSQWKAFVVHKYSPAIAKTVPEMAQKVGILILPNFYLPVGKRGGGGRGG
jgi:hypothetical protein